MLFNGTDMPIDQGNARTPACALKHYVNAHASSTSMEWVFVSLPYQPSRQRRRMDVPA